MKKWTALAVTLLMFTVTYGILTQFFMKSNPDEPVASDGRLELSGWDFAENGTVRLDGQWEFYPGELLTHQDFKRMLTSSLGTAALTPRYIDVPRSWAGEMDTLGMATYRLLIRVDDAEPLYGLKTLSVQMANRMYVNGVEVGSAGNPGGPAEYSANIKPYVSYFNVQPGWNELIVQVANFSFQAGAGINNSIVFGESPQIARLRDVALTHDLMAICCFAIIGVYFIGLYTQRKSDYSHLVFGLMCVCMSLFLSVRGERLLLVLLESMPYWLYIRVQTVSVYAGSMFLFMYIYVVFRPYCNRRLIYAGVATGVILGLATLGFVDYIYYRPFLLMTTVYGTFPFIYATYVFVLAALYRAEGSLYLAIAAIALNHHVMIQNLNVYANMPLYAVVPFEAFLVLLMLALLMSLRFSNAFKKIEQLSVQLLKADKLKDDFLSRTSHEFKTPLHSIITISRSMIEDTNQPLPAEQRDKLELVLGVSKRLSQLVLDILDLAKLKQGDLTVRPVPVDVRSTAEIALRIFSFMAAGKNVRFLNHVPERLPNALADENRLRQIFNNLIDNALKHTDEGSIEIAAEERGGFIEIRVKDTGSGIDPELIDHIFEPFQTFERAEGNRGDSFGLGLSIVKQLVELQQGSISVASESGAGTVFTFTLPVAAAAAGNRKAAREIAASAEANAAADYAFPTPYYSEQTGRHTILVVDDHYLNLKILIDALKPLDCMVIAVKNGFEAMEQLGKANSVDLVVLDLMMPGMSGYEVCQTIRKKYTLLEMPVLMVTTANQPQDKLAAFDAGANDFLPKPFDTTELKARVKGLLLLKDSLGKAIDLEVAFLQSQIKPHFLYNVLNTIQALSYTDVGASRKLTTDLADYLRGSFRFSNVQKRTAFGQELGLIRSYVEIERVRFKHRLHVDYDIEESVSSLSIPPLLLQPIVENAIRHGIGGRTEGGTVKITARRAECGYNIVIEDDGVGMEPELLRRLLAGQPDTMSQGVGLRNIIQRMKYEYNSELTIDSAPGEGTRVTVFIPEKGGSAAVLPE